MQLYLSQINPIVGDLKGNHEKLCSAWKKAKEMGADLIVFPELAITGYPPEDLVLMPSFQQAAMQAVEKLANETVDGPAIITGGIWHDGTQLYNSAFLIEEGNIARIQFKHHLPNYGVFDEKRVFACGPLPEVVEWRGIRIGLLVCEDMWGDESVAHVAKQNPDVLISINASPYERGKMSAREEVARDAVSTCRAPLFYVNTVGGQDEIVFDGRSFVMDASGEVCGKFKAFEEQVSGFGFQVSGKEIELLSPDSWNLEPKALELLYLAMMTGVRDYVEKNNFPGVVIGLSGGIDSALTACVAVDALGPERVHCVMMPSKYTSDISVVDATKLATELGVTYNIVTIAQGMEAVEGMLAGIRDQLTSLAMENIQPRIRGLLLMAISNSTGKILLTTGNKSEMATGYATLYGDMCGAFNVLKDLYKMEVYALSEWRNMSMPQGAKGPEGAVIPERIISRPPSAELKPDQTDQDTLPPYATLDAILKGLVEERLSVEDLTARGFEKTMIEQVAGMLFRSEYKRRQAPPGVKLSSMSFGRDRRYPLTNGFKL
ncbi:MAG: NAD+ synthase [Rickettsiales bacterium]